VTRLGLAAAGLPGKNCGQRLAATGECGCRRAAPGRENGAQQARHTRSGAVDPASLPDPQSPTERWTTRYGTAVAADVGTGCTPGYPREAWAGHDGPLPVTRGR